MRKNRLTLPTVFASIGALLNIVISYIIAYFATGGTFFAGEIAFDFGNMWLAAVVMAMVAPILSLIGALILANAPRTAGVFLIISALEYLVVGLLVKETSAVPYLLLGSVGTVILFVTGVYSFATPYMKEIVNVEYTKERKFHPEAQNKFAENKNH